MKGAIVSYINHFKIFCWKLPGTELKQCTTTFIPKILMNLSTQPQYHLGPFWIFSKLIQISAKFPDPIFPWSTNFSSFFNWFQSISYSNLQLQGNYFKAYQNRFQLFKRFINFQNNKIERVFIAGLSGSGKTSVFHVLATGKPITKPPNTGF